MNGRTPKWVVDALSQSDAPKEIVEALIGSESLAPLWNKLSGAERSRVWSLPDFIGFATHPQGAKRIPFSDLWTPAEQRRQAQRVARLARDLNNTLAEFSPFAPAGLQRFIPRANHNEHLFLASLPPVASKDPQQLGLLQLIAEAAERFKAIPAQRVQRPRRPDAYQTYLARTLGPLFKDPVGHQFVAELVNIFAGGEWDSERVRKSLASSRKSKST